jgi:2-polyprenyl-3-methyl-5-hydroxy-6-metoxy-1,4-benzoquinol methylase
MTKNRLSRPRFSNYFRSRGAGMISVGRRRRQPEVMDQPGLCPQRHAVALRGLARLNFFGSVGVLWGQLVALARRHPGQPLRVLDLATGGGDIPLRLWRRARKANIALHIEGCDLNPFAVAHANAAAARAGADVRFFVHDAIRGGSLPGYDAAISSLFLHHLDAGEAVAFLRLMAASGRHVLVNDLERSRLNFAMVYLASRLLTRSPVVHVDAPRSVEAAFTPREALELAEQAGLSGATVERRWPCRFLLAWERR